MSPKVCDQLIFNFKGHYRRQQIEEASCRLTAHVDSTSSPTVHSLVRICSRLRTVMVLIQVQNNLKVSFGKREEIFLYVLICSSNLAAKCFCLLNMLPREFVPPINIAVPVGTARKTPRASRHDPNNRFKALRQPVRGTPEPKVTIFGAQAV